MDQWISTDELEEACSAVEMVAEVLGGVAADCYRWRWAILALHATVQGFMVCALRGGNGLAAMPDVVEEKWLQAYRNGTERPAEKLDSFLNLYKKTKSKRMMFFVHSRSFAPQGSQGTSIKKLNALRNEFTHFLPRSWSLEVGDLPRIAADCIDFVRFLAFESGNILWYRDGQRERVQRAIGNAREVLVALEAEAKGGA